MASFNKVLLMGNLTRDPELRVTPKGTAICQFGIAVNRQFKGEDGTTRDDVTYVDVEAWGKTGETIAKFLTKGKPIFIEGRLKFDQWEDKTTGEKRSKLKVVCENFQFLGGKDAPGPGDVAREAGWDKIPDRPSPPPRNSPPPRQSAAQRQENLDEDVPF